MVENVHTINNWTGEGQVRRFSDGRSELYNCYFYQHSLVPGAVQVIDDIPLDLVRASAG